MDYVIVGGELYHYGVPGMKWGRRKARPVATGTGRRGLFQRQQTSNTMTPEQKQARKQKVKKAVKIGATVVGTALAAYGAYKVTKLVQKNRQAKARAAQLAFERKWREDMARSMANAGNIAESNGVKYLSRTVTDFSGNVIDRRNYG